jgi:hypothetical protein
VLNILRIVAVMMLMLASSAAAQSKEDGKALRNKPWAKSDGDFGAMLFLTDKPDELFAAWEKPGAGVPFSSTAKAERGVPIVAVIFFTGCAADDKGPCQASVRFTAYQPDGKLYDEPVEGELWTDKPPPPKGQMQLSVGNMGFVLEPEDPLGVYKVKAKVVDNVAKKTLVLEREFTAVEAARK